MSKCRKQKADPRLKLFGGRGQKTRGRRVGDQGIRISGGRKSGEQGIRKLGDRPAKNAKIVELRVFSGKKTKGLIILLTSLTELGRMPIIS